MRRAFWEKISATCCQRDKLWLDLGFIGYNPENAEIYRPEKKPKGKELTDEQKKSNRLISRTRVKVEHAIGNCKIFRIVKEEIRAYKNDFRDLAFNMKQPQANLWIHLLKRILNTSLEKAKCIPCRTVEALNKLLVEGQDVLIDGT